MNSPPGTCTRRGIWPLARFSAAVAAPPPETTANARAAAKTRAHRPNPAPVGPMSSMAGPRTIAAHAFSRAETTVAKRSGTEIFK